MKTITAYSYMIREGNSVRIRTHKVLDILAEKHLEDLETKDVSAIHPVDVYDDEWLTPVHGFFGLFKNV